MVKAENIGAAYNNNSVFSNINFEITKGNRTLISGKNGSGKSTLIKIIAGLKAPSEGSLRAPAIKALCAPFFSPYEELSLSQNGRFVSSSTGYTKRIKELAKHFRIERTDVPLSELSTGTKQKAKIAIALALEAELYLFDEPGLGLDADSHKTMVELFSSVEQTIVIATNDMIREFSFTQEINLD